MLGLVGCLKARRIEMGSQVPVSAVILRMQILTDTALLYWCKRYFCVDCLSASNVKAICEV